MPKAMWNGVLIADAPAGAVTEVEGNIYFPKDSVKDEYLRPSDKHTTCAWKGVASYYDLEVDGKMNAGAAWFYPDPKSAAANIRDHVAFWKGVEVSK